MASEWLRSVRYRRGRFDDAQARAREIEPVRSALHSYPREAAVFELYVVDAQPAKAVAARLHVSLRQFHRLREDLAVRIERALDVVPPTDPAESMARILHESAPSRAVSFHELSNTATPENPRYAHALLIAGARPLQVTTIGESPEVLLSGAITTISCEDWGELERAARMREEIRLRLPSVSPTQRVAIEFELLASEFIGARHRGRITEMRAATTRLRAIAGRDELRLLRVAHGEALAAAGEGRFDEAEVALVLAERTATDLANLRHTIDVLCTKAQIRFAGGEFAEARAIGAAVLVAGDVYPYVEAECRDLLARIALLIEPDAIVNRSETPFAQPSWYWAVAQAVEARTLLEQSNADEARARAEAVCGMPEARAYRAVNAWNAVTLAAIANGRRRSDREVQAHLHLAWCDLLETGDRFWWPDAFAVRGLPARDIGPIEYSPAFAEVAYAAFSRKYPELEHVDAARSPFFRRLRRSVVDAVAGPGVAHAPPTNTPPVAVVEDACQAFGLLLGPSRREAFRANLRARLLD